MHTETFITMNIKNWREIMMNNKFAIIISNDIITKEGTNLKEGFEYLKNNNVLDWGTDAQIAKEKQNIMKEGDILV